MGIINCFILFVLYSSPPSPRSLLLTQAPLQCRTLHQQLGECDPLTCLPDECTLLSRLISTVVTVEGIENTRRATGGTQTVPPPGQNTSE
jgi:hypothetical protein